MTVDLSHPVQGDLTFTPDGPHQAISLVCLDAFAPSVFGSAVQYRIAVHPVVGLCKAYFMAVSCWILGADSHTDPEEYEVRRRRTQPFCTECFDAHQDLHVAGVLRRSSAPEGVHAVFALPDHRIRCDAMSRNRDVTP